MTSPSLDQVRELPKIYETEVPAAFLDRNGHMNVQHYLGVHDAAGWPFFRSLGMDESYFTERKLGIFDLEHHLRYFAECHLGDRIAVHAWMLALHRKRMHAIWFIVNESRASVANSLEFVCTHADLAARKTAPWPDDVFAALERVRGSQGTPSWDPPVCGVMGV
ncbi:MAG: thioesterase family protein [Myxococcota bacterium]